MIGTTLKQLRKEAGISQGQAAKAAGVSGTYLSLVEGNKTPGSLDFLDRISTVVGVPLAVVFILSLEDPRRKSELSLVKTMISKIYGIGKGGANV